MTRNKIYIQMNPSKNQAIDSIASARFTSNAVFTSLGLKTVRFGMTLTY